MAGSPGQALGTTTVRVKERGVRVKGGAYRQRLVARAPFVSACQAAPKRAVMPPGSTRAHSTSLDRYQESRRMVAACRPQAVSIQHGVMKCFLRLV